MLIFSESFEESVNHMIYNKLTDVTASAFRKKKIKVEPEQIKNLNDKILDYIYQNNESQNKKRIIATDSTLVYVSKEVESDKLSIGNNNSCKIMQLNILYDIESQLPIDYRSDKRGSDKKTLENQINSLKKGDILVMDSGYLKFSLVGFLIENGIDIVLNLPTDGDLKCIKKLKKTKWNECMYDLDVGDNKYVKVRIVKYKLNTEKGDIVKYIMTTLNKDEYPIEYIKELYHKRWDIEVHIRYDKHILSMNYLNCKTYNNCLINIYIHQLIHIIVFYISNFIGLEKTLANNDTDKNNNNSTYVKKISKKVVFTNITEFLRLHFYCTSKKDKSCQNEKKRDIIIIFLNNIVVYKLDRNYERVRKRPLPKWTTSGSTTNRPNNKKSTKNQKICNENEKFTTTQKVCNDTFSTFDDCIVDDVVCEKICDFKYASNILCDL